MAGAGRNGRSRGELIRRRERAQFVGRRAQLSLFTDNLAKDPESEGDPAEFLFHVRGVGGVGKSTLLRQWQEVARQAGALTAVVDESDVHGVPQALSRLARQLAEQSGPLKEYERAAEQFRREQEAAAETALAEDAGASGGGSAAGAAGGPGGGEGEASVSSRLVAQAVVGAASLIPGAAAVTAMTDPGTAAQGLDRLRARVRGRRARTADPAGLSAAFVSELVRLCGRRRWVVLFFDTWELTGRYLDAWLRELLKDAFGPLPLNVIVVLAGRDELAEREWGPLRAQVADVPLEVFTEAETRALLAARGVAEPGTVEAVLQQSMGLPLLVDLLALARPEAAEDVEVDGDVADAAVKRFVQWITDARQRETVLACALPPQLNEDVFAAAAPPEGRGLWEWLCGQPFVSGNGEFKQYHAVVRASMVRQQRTRSPQRWRAAHTALAAAHAAWREAVEPGLSESRRRADARWRRHRLDETYHLLCARPAAALPGALEQAVHAAERDEAVVRQWIDLFDLAARDTADPVLLSWAGRLQASVDDPEPAPAYLRTVLTHRRLSVDARAWAHTYLGYSLYLHDHDEEALAELDRAVALSPGNARALGYRGEVHRWLGHTEQAVADLTAALELEPGYAQALSERGAAHRVARRFDEAVADLTAALELDPESAWAFNERGIVHRLAGRNEEAVADFTAALDLDPNYARALAERGAAHRQANRFDEAVADLTAALELDPEFAWALNERGMTHRQANRLPEAVADLTAALELDAGSPWTLVERGIAHRLAGRFDEAVADLTAALDLDPGYARALAERAAAHRRAGRLDVALADLAKALELDPAFGWALSERGEVHRLAGRLDEALADFTAALAVNPADGWALGSRGQVHRLAGRHQEAVADLTAALELQPSLDWALVERGEALRLSGRLAEAVADFTAALTADPADGWTRGSRGQAHRQAGRLEEAVADLTAALALDPELDWALVERGMAHRLAGRYEEAVADFTAALALDPEFTHALAQRGEAHRQAGRLDEAVADLTVALERDPGYVWALGERGEAHRLAGRLDAALADFSAALALDPTDVWALARRGQTHRMAARYDEAVADLTAALAAEPGSVWAFTERGEAHRTAGRFDEAVADFTAALRLDPAHIEALALRGMAHRLAGRPALARKDLGRAAAIAPDFTEILVELLVLDTLESGLAACLDRWRELFAGPGVAELDDEEAARGELYRVLLLEPGADPVPAVDAFLAHDPLPTSVIDLLQALAEFAVLGGDPAERALRAHRRLTDHLTATAG